MSPKEADPRVRLALIEQGARLLAEEGRRALTLRRLTSLVGVSTMAVYTHFGSMDDLHRAIRQEGFARLAASMEAVDRTDDPVADLALLGWAYVNNALTNPALYAAMFMEDRKLVTDRRSVGLETFDSLVTAVRRCQEGKRFGPGDPVEMATQAWVMVHGIAALAIAGYLTEPEALACLERMGTNLVGWFAVDAASVEASLSRAVARLDLYVSGISLPDR